MHLRSIGTKCDSQADLAGALCHECTEYPEYAHAGQKNRNDREQDQREHVEFRAGELRLEEVVNRGCLRHGFRRVDFLERPLSEP